MRPGRCDAAGLGLGPDTPGGAPGYTTTTTSHRGGAVAPLVSTPGHAGGVISVSSAGADRTKLLGAATVKRAGTGEASFC